MGKLEKAIYELDRMERTTGQSSLLHSIDARAKLLVTLCFLITVLSLPLENISSLIFYIIYPIIACAMAEISYGHIIKRSLFVLPFILFIGVFNPIFDKQVVFYVGKMGITSGWISFFSILIRGLISAQAAFILIYSTGFYNLCRGMQRMGIPSLLTTQFLFVYRYVFVLLQEALSMDRARESRSFGKKVYSVRMWGIFIGQLLIRTIDRSERIHRAMLSRGFTGNVEGNWQPIWQMRDTFYLLVWCVCFLLLRTCHPADLFRLFINH